MLFDIAVVEGKIRSIYATAAEYRPELGESEYAKTPLRALLHLPSGVEFREVYDGYDGIDRFDRALFNPLGPARSSDALQSPRGAAWSALPIRQRRDGAVRPVAAQGRGDAASRHGLGVAVVF